MIVFQYFLFFLSEQTDTKNLEIKLVVVMNQQLLEIRMTKQKSNIFNKTHNSFPRIRFGILNLSPKQVGIKGQVGL